MGGGVDVGVVWVEVERRPARALLLLLLQGLVT